MLNDIRSNKKGSKNKSGKNNRDSIACHRKPQENESHQDNRQKTNEESRKGIKKEKQEHLKSRLNENNGKKTGQKHKSANKDEMNRSAQEAVGSNLDKNDQNKQVNQNQPKTGQNSDGSKQKKQGKKSVIFSHELTVKLVTVKQLMKTTLRQEVMELCTMNLNGRKIVQTGISRAKY